MINNVKKTIATAAFIIFAANPILAKELGFISYQTIQEKFPEAQQCSLRIQSQVEEWKRDLGNLQKDIVTLEQDIEKNRLIWNDDEKLQKDKELTNKRKERADFAKAKFSRGGDYDKLTIVLMKPIEEKINADLRQTKTSRELDSLRRGTK